LASSAVEALGLNKTFDDGTEAVRDLRFTVEKGTLFCLVGPDGAGKTTTVRLLSGIIRPTSGNARIFGLDLLREGNQIKRRIGYLSQRFTLYGDLTVDENIEFFAELHEVRQYKKHRDDLLAFTRLAPFRRRLAEKLSGGMKQKLALACTLIHTPDLLLLDEPTTGVDPVSRRDFWKILLRLLQSGITIIMTTPYLDEAERGSSVGLMNHGVFMVVDRPQKIKAMMAGSIIEVVCDDIRKAAAAVRNMAEVREVQTFGDRLHFVVGDAGKDFPGIERRLCDEGLCIRHWRLIPPSLENVFISLTRGERAHG
jgi:ABC-2 type transport system ATP-binding protein